MRKLMLALVCSAFMAGLVIADTYTIVSYKEKVLTVKDKDDKEVKATATDKTKVTITDKAGNKKEGKLEDIEKRWSKDNAVGKNAELTIVDGKITEIMIKSKK